MSRSQLLKSHFVSLKDILMSINHLDCRILEDGVRSELIAELVQWYVSSCGPLDTRDVLRKGWKGFEQMDDLELIEDWLEIRQLNTISYPDEEFEALECATDIEAALHLKIKLANDILAS